MIALLVGCALHRHPAPHTEHHPVHHVATEDGASVAIQHLSNPGGDPVLLVHGVSSNHHFWDLEPGRSLAVDLFEHGFDVYNLDLRGHGLAVRDAQGRRQRHGWTIDDYARFDLPAALSFVQQTSESEQVAYVGHSLGGMVLSIYLASTEAPPLSSAVVVASPLEFSDLDPVAGFLIGHGRSFGFIRRWPTPLAALWLSTLAEHAPLRADALLFSRDGLSRPARRRMLRRIVSPMVAGEVAQLSLASDGVFRSSDGAVAYREALGHVTVPMLFFAGRADHVAAPDRVRAYYDAVGSPDKTFVIASRTNGFAHDYGHLDLGVGDHAATDVFVRIRAFLEAH